MLSLLLFALFGVLPTLGLTPGDDAVACLQEGGTISSAVLVGLLQKRITLDLTVYIRERNCTRGPVCNAWAWIEDTVQLACMKRDPELLKLCTPADPMLKTAQLRLGTNLGLAVVALSSGNNTATATLPTGYPTTQGGFNFGGLGYQFGCSVDPACEVGFIKSWLTNWPYADFALIGFISDHCVVVGSPFMSSGSKGPDSWTETSLLYYTKF